MNYYVRPFPLVVLLAIGAICPVIGNAARAEAISYSLSFCENLDVLKDPTNSILAANVSKATQHTLMMQRTSPYFELRNTSGEAVITQLSLSIGDASKNFDWAKLVEASPGVSFTLNTVDAVMGGTKSDLLTISFSGFDPGDFIRFRFGVSADDPSATLIQDYRTVLFDLNGNDPSDNAIVKVDFESGGLTEQLQDQLPDFSMNGLTTATNMAFPNGPCFDHVVPFQFDASGSIDTEDPEEPGPQVPEPGSYALFGIGTLVLAAYRLKRRKRA